MEWMCAECGAPHPKNNPPCRNCGAMQFEKTTVRVDPGDEQSNHTSIEWECTECGRTTPKNNPPCSRCGNMNLEAIELGSSFDESETTASVGIRDAGKFVGAIAVVAVLAFVLVNSGVLNQTSGTPTVESIPGDANRSSGLNLDTVEYQIYDAINGKRSSEGLRELSLEPSTADVADYYNKRMVKRDESPVSVSSEFESCPNPELVHNQIEYDFPERRAIAAYNTESELSDVLSSSWLGDSDTRAVLLDGSASSMGVDVHVNETGAIYATVAYC